MSKLVNVSVKVPRELRELMRRVNVNWGDYLRSAIEAKVKEELAKQASFKLDEIKSRSKPISTEVLVRWIREERRSK